MAKRPRYRCPNCGHVAYRFQEWVDAPALYRMIYPYRLLLSERVRDNTYYSLKSQKRARLSTAERLLKAVGLEPVLATTIPYVWPS